MTMFKNLLFGISGLPLGDGSRKFNQASAIEYVKAIGLDAMELLFVRSVTVTAKNKDVILQARRENDLYLSAHGSYYINLNSDEKGKQLQSIERIRLAAEALASIRGKSLVFHPGYYLKDSKEHAYRTIKENLSRLPRTGIDYRLETTGKGAQFGTLKEPVSLCKEVSSCKLCIDFSHIHARNNGGLRAYDDFAEILHYVSTELGISALEDLHMHMGGIRYSEKGERNHLPLGESDFNYKACLKALKEFGVRGCVIVEGPLVEKDALLLKNTYKEL
jgi:deoxyribonuclease IV